MTLRRVAPGDVQIAQQELGAEVVAGARAIVERVRREGEPALRGYAMEFDDLAEDAPLVIEREALEAAAAALPAEQRALLERVAARVRAFAEAQRGCLSDLTMPLPGGTAGHRVAPVAAAGCYAPGGRYPLPSSVIMTVVTARAAGVKRVVVASPRPTPVTLAAAAIAGADALLPIGGAQAIAALAFGAGPIAPVDVVVGPGNAWVTAAKQQVAGHVGIDMLAGPSELLVLADDQTDPDIIAADLLAQAEHAPDARPILVTLDAALVPRVEAALERQLEVLPTAAVARQALATGFAVVCDGIDEAIDACNRLAPEHLQVLVRDAPNVASRLEHYGGLFVGPLSAEVLGDYGAGPNHVLPTGGAARHTGGLSVLTFLRVRTFLALDDADAARGLAEDAAALADLEGLAGHAAAARLR